jgi:PAS domain S-box-containing protein
MHAVGKRPVITVADPYRYTVGGIIAVMGAVLCTLLTALFVQLLGGIAAQQTRPMIGHSLSQLAMQNLEKLDGVMAERYREVRLMAQRDDVVGQLTSPTAKRHVLNALADSSPHYAWIGIADLDGKVSVAAHQLLEGTDVSDRPWFKDALRGITVQGVHDSILFRKDLPVPTEGQPPRVPHIAFPYRDADGDVIGVLGVQLSWDWAKRGQQSTLGQWSEGPGIESLVVDRDGVVLLGPPRLLGARINQQSFRLAREGRRGFVIETWPDGHSYLVGYSHSAPDGSPGLGWTVLVRQQAESAFAPVTAMERKVVWIGILLAALVSLVGMALARHIARPLTTIARDAQRMAHGEIVPVQSAARLYDEARVLRESLCSLVSDLLQREALLRDLNAHLERHVAARTVDLERALERACANEQRIQSILQTALDAFIGVDEDGIISEWNPPAEQLFGWSRAEALGQRLAELIFTPACRDIFTDVLRRYRSAAGTDLEHRRFERLVVDRHGRFYEAEMTIGVASHAGETHFGVFIQDISKRKEVERLTTGFISTASHELRTPLTSISATLSMLGEGMAGELPADAIELIDMANSSCEWLVHLINDILDLERIEAGLIDLNPHDHDLADLARQAIAAMRGLATARGIELIVDLPDEPVIVCVDAHRVIQVGVNLLSNAIKFSRRGQQVTMRVTAGHSNGSLSVLDRGRGMPAEFHERIFQKFAQADSTDSRDKGGSGLGLSICKHIVEAHHGCIWFTSEVGNGTTFHVELPLRPASAVQPRGCRLAAARRG